jgi:hypothetical protein
LAKSFFNFHNVILLAASIVSWGLVYAFIEKEECSKKEKTFGQSWEIAQISCFVPMLVFAVHVLRR